MSKAISKGTLSLKFMQNAQRAKQQAEVELEQAKIKDEAEWEVSQELREAWGIGTSSAFGTSSVTHESSYIPFLFGSEDAESSQEIKPKGRRSFNAQGQEVQAETKSMDETAAVDEDPLRDSKPHKRISAISGFKAPLPVKSKAGKKMNTKTVQELIREDVKKRPPASQSGFLKPSGVDMPTASNPHIVRHGSGPSLKRDRDTESADSFGSDVKKNKKIPRVGMRMID